MDASRLSTEEANLERLLRSAYGPSARPDPAAGAALLARLHAELPSAPVLGPRRLPADMPASFPDAALLLLAGAFLLAAAWLLSRLSGGGSSLAADPALVLAAVAIAANLVLAPAAGAVIVYRRRYA
jgi:hypothetical protein